MNVKLAKLLGLSESYIGSFKNRFIKKLTLVLALILWALAWVPRSFYNKRFVYLYIRF